MSEKIAKRKFMDFMKGISDYHEKGIAISMENMKRERNMAKKLRGVIR